MYQLTNYGGSGLQVVTPDPPDAGGAAINANFKALATQIATGNPGIDDDSTAGFGVGSRWYNSATTVEWICLGAAPGDAEWAAVASGALAGYLPLTGGTLTGTLNMGGNAVNMNSGGGTGGTTLNMDGGAIYGSAPSSGQTGGTWNLGDGSGSHGGTLNIEEGTLNMQGGTLNTGGGGLDLGGGEILNCNALLLNSLYCTSIFAYLGPTLAFGSTVDMQGNQIDMNTGGGSGGGPLNMDQGVLAFDNVVSAQGDGAGTLTFTGVASVVGLPGFSTPNLASVLSTGNNAAGAGINMNDGGGTGGGTLNMDDGSIRDCSALLGYAGLLRVPTTVDMLGYTLNMNTGGGTGGGTLNMDEGSILNCGALLGYAGLLRVPTTVDMLGYTLNMYDGVGSGGGSLNLDRATLAFDSVASVSGNGAGSLDFTGVTAVTGFPGLAPSLDLVLGTGNDAAGTGINMNAGSGTGGGTLSMDGGTIYGSAPGSGQPGGTWSLGDGTGAHGGTLNMEDGDILNCDAIYGYASTLKVSALNMLGYPLGNAGTLQLNATTAPGSPTPGTMYFDSSTNKMNYWNGSAWVAW